MKIKVAHITQSLGGVKTYLENIFQYSDSNDFEYVLIAPEHSELQEYCNSKFVTYYPIKIRRSINPILDFAAFIKIISILKAEKPDIVHTHSAKGGFLGRLAAKFFTSAKVVYNPHAFSYLSFKGVKRIIFYSLECIAKKWTDMLLSVSISEANRGIYEVGFNTKFVHTIVNAVEVDEQLPFRNYDSCTNIGMIARLTYQKNPLLFLEIAKALTNKYPKLTFSVLGAGMCDHLSSDIYDYIQKNDLAERVKILPWGDNATSRQFLLQTDIFMLTSVFEGLPFSLLEAMALGIPCVVSKVDGNTDVINNNENGYSCLSVNEFENKVELLIKSEDLRRQFGRAGHRYIKDFHEIEKNIMLLQDLYEKLYYSDGLINMKKRDLKSIEEELIHLKTSPGI